MRAEVRSQILRISRECTNSAYIHKNLFSGQSAAKCLTHQIFTESRVPRNRRFLMNAGFCPRGRAINRTTTQLKLFEDKRSVIFDRDVRKASFNALFDCEVRSATKPAFIGFIPLIMSTQTAKTAWVLLIFHIENLHINNHFLPQISTL